MFDRVIIRRERIKDGKVLYAERAISALEIRECAISLEELMAFYYNLLGEEFDRV